MRGDALDRLTTERARAGRPHRAPQAYSPRQTRTTPPWTPRPPGPWERPHTIQEHEGEGRLPPEDGNAVSSPAVVSDERLHPAMLTSVSERMGMAPQPGLC